MNTVRDAAVITAAGTAALGFIGWYLMRARRAQGWPTTQGMVVAAEIEDQSDSESRSLVVKILYRYTVAGTVYESERVDYFDRTKHRLQSTADAQRKEYKPGTTLRVHYNPQAPGEAAVRVDVPRGWYFVLAFAAIFFIGGLSGLINALR